eukprot:302438-Alexandrium_andersonii.AAC.1
MQSSASSGSSTTVFVLWGASCSRVDSRLHIAIPDHPTFLCRRRSDVGTAAQRCSTSGAQQHGGPA